MHTPSARPFVLDDVFVDLSDFGERPARFVPRRAFAAVPLALLLGYWAGGHFSRPPGARAPDASPAVPAPTLGPPSTLTSPAAAGGSDATPTVHSTELAPPSTSLSAARLALPAPSVQPPGASAAPRAAVSAPSSSRGSSAATAPGRKGAHRSGRTVGASSTSVARTAAGLGSVRERIALPAPTGGAGAAALKTRASSLAEAGQWPAALDLYTRAARAAPRDADAWFGIGLCQVELGQPKAATKTARYALTLAPAHVLCHVLAGFLSQERRGYAEAREHYERALALEPDGPFAPELESVLAQLPLPAAPARPRPTSRTSSVALVRASR